MTFLIHAGCGGDMSASNYGIDYCWGGYRLKQQALRWFGAGDGRASYFFTGDSAIAHGDTLADGSSKQLDSVASIGDYHSGIPAPKFTNKTAAGGNGAQTTMVDTDFPIFRLADAFLIYAEANLRGGGGTLVQAETYVDDLRSRAYGNSSDNLAPGTLTLDTLLAERGRELLFEASRRTDLVRFGLFSSPTYVWAWKGGTAGGTGLPLGRDLYPLPGNELLANPNLKQNTGY